MSDHIAADTYESQQSDFVFDEGYLDEAPEDHPYENLGGAYDSPEEPYNPEENPYDTADYSQYADAPVDEDPSQVYFDPGDGYEYGNSDYTGNEPRSIEPHVGGDEMYEQGEHSQIYQPEFNGRSPGESLELSAFSEQSYEQAEYSQYTDYPQQDHNEQRPAERSLEQPGHPVGSAKQTPSQGAHSRAGPATEKQSAPRTQPNAGHPNTHQRTASGPPRQPQPGRSGVPISKPIPAHIPQRSIHSSPLAHPPQFNPAQPPRAIPAPSPRPGAPQPNPLQNPQAFPYTQHRSNQQHPARQVTPQTSPQMHSNRSPNIQNLPPQHVQLPNSHQIPGRGHPTQVQVRRPSSPHNAQRPFAGRPISPHHSIGQTHSLGAPHTPMHQVTTLPSRNPGAGPAKPMPNPHQPPHQPPHAAVPYNMSSPQNLVSGSLHHTQQSPVSHLPVKLAPAISPVAHAILPVPHSGFPIPHAITPVTPPPGYLPPQEPKGQDGKIVNHQHELKITHEYIAPPISGNHQSHQPTATPRMVANSKGGGDRNVKRLPVIAGRGRVWSSGLCSFTDLCDTCCLACWCPCIVYGQNKARLDYLSSHGISDPEHGGSPCSGDCCLHGSLTSFCAFGWVLQISTRKNIRSRYNVQGSGLEDCCMAFLCGPCALTQESREMSLEEQSLAVKR